MKKQYISPEMDVLLLELSDIITASGPIGGGGGGSVEKPGDDDDFGFFNINWN